MPQNYVPLPTQFQSFIHLSRYSRWLHEENRRESWTETVSRYFDFFETHLKENTKFSLTKALRAELESAILNLEVMPSMRCLMTAGEALTKSNIAGYNCAYTTVNRVRAFDEILYVLLNGTGVGFSIERQYVERLPTIAEEFSQSNTTIIVEDSKGGWAKSYKELISLLIGGQIPKWDLSKLRPAGARLKTFGGRASGPAPLDELFRFTMDSFKRAAGRKLTSIECHDIVCKIAEVVVVGGVRRSALISLSNLTDEKMRDAKTGAWWNENPQRALSNNSIAYKEKPEMGVFMEEWISLYKSKSGERGIFNREAARKTVEKLGDRRDPNYDWGCNPCCLPGNVLVETNLGQIPISEIVNDPEGFFVLTHNHETDQKEYTEIIDAAMTRPNANLLQLDIIDDSGNLVSLKLTPDHKVWTENRGYVEAQNLNEDDEVIISSNYIYIEQGLPPKKLYMKPKSIQQIMKWYKEVQTKNHTVNQLKIPSERQVWMQNNPLSPKLKSELFKYYHDGNGFKSIAKELGLSYTKIRVLLIVWLDLDYRKGMSVITKRLKERRRYNATGSKSNFYNWVEKYPERAKKQTKSIQGWYIKKNGEKVWLRSSLEYIYAKWLDKTDCDWITEERTLKWNDETYRPDFFVYKDKKLIEIVEVKGNYFDNVDKRSKKAILIAKNNNIPLKLVMDIKPYIEEESNYTKELQKWKDLQKQFTEK